VAGHGSRIVEHRRERGHVDERGAEVFRSSDRSVAIRKGRALARRKCGQLIVKKRGGKLDFAEDFAAIER